MTNMTTANSIEVDKNPMVEIINVIENILTVYIIPITSAFGLCASIATMVLICRSKKIRIFQKYIFYKNLFEVMFFLIGLSFFYRISINCTSFTYEKVFYSLYFNYLGLRIILHGMVTFNIYLLWNRLSFVSENKNSIFLSLKGPWNGKHIWGVGGGHYESRWCIGGKALC